MIATATANCECNSFRLVRNTKRYTRVLRTGRATLRKAQICHRAGVDFNFRANSSATVRCFGGRTESDLRWSQVATRCFDPTILAKLVDTILQRSCTPLAPVVKHLARKQISNPSRRSFVSLAVVIFQRPVNIPTIEAKNEQQTTATSFTSCPGRRPSAGSTSHAVRTAARTTRSELRQPAIISSRFAAN